MRQRVIILYICYKHVFSPLDMIEWTKNVVESKLMMVPRSLNTSLSMREGTKQAREKLLTLCAFDHVAGKIVLNQYFLSYFPVKATFNKNLLPKQNCIRGFTLFLRKKIFIHYLSLLSWRNKMDI